MSEKGQQLTSPDAIDYSFASMPARIALYDDMRSAPRITQIDPSEASQYIENLTTTIYEQARSIGGSIPYTVIREVSENFIHASFKEIVVSILDSGNTIRFTDQGPGISSKEKAVEPGFSSAVEPMKRYIRGVGSGLPIVREYLGLSGGHIYIEDNLTCGAVVTISLKPEDISTTSLKHENHDYQRVPAYIRYATYETTHIQAILAPFSSREHIIISLLMEKGPIGVTTLAQLSNTAPSSVHAIVTKLEEANIVEKGLQKKRILTPLGRACAEYLASLM